MAAIDTVQGGSQVVQQVQQAQQAQAAQQAMQNQKAASDAVVPQAQNAHHLRSADDLAAAANPAVGSNINTTA
jgi:hypothetical protein